MIDKKTCSCCKQDKPRSDFGKNSSTPNGLDYTCKPCGAAKKRKYKYRNYGLFKVRRRVWKVKRAVGPAAIHYETYRDEITQIYLKRPEGLDVDHIIPINGGSVCGLHVPWNLQYLTREENVAKSNKYSQDLPVVVLT